MQEGLLQSVSPRPGQPEIISVFPAWPKQWDASFRLLARGSFLVTSSVKSGQVEFIEVESRLGETCRLRNPWGRDCVVKEIGGSTKEFSGDILRFETQRGKKYRILPKGGPILKPHRISPKIPTEPTELSISISRKIDVTWKADGPDNKWTTPDN